MNNKPFAELFLWARTALADATQRKTSETSSSVKIYDREKKLRIGLLVLAFWRGHAPACPFIYE